MALIIGIIVGLSRMSSDSELVVLRACGLGLNVTLIPVFLLASITFIFSCLISFYIRPIANVRLNSSLYEIAKINASSGLIEGAFNEFGPFTIYSEVIKEKGKKLTNVLISDSRGNQNTKTFISKSGSIYQNLNSELVIDLFDGSILEGSNNNQSRTFFDKTSIVINQSLLNSDNSQDQENKVINLTFAELLKEISNITDNIKSAKNNNLLYSNILKVELGKRIAIPFSAFFISLIAISLGIGPSRGAGPWTTALNILAGLFIILLYYFLIAAMTALGEQGKANGILIMWVPNLICGGIGIYLYKKITTEKWIAVSYELQQKLLYMLSKINLKKIKAS